MGAEQTQNMAPPPVQPVGARGRYVFSRAFSRSAEPARTVREAERLLKSLAQIVMVPVVCNRKRYSRLRFRRESRMGHVCESVEKEKAASMEDLQATSM